MEICSAAAEVWFESEEIGFRAVGGPWLVIETALDLIRLLVILVRPHVCGKGTGQRVEGEQFQAVWDVWNACGHDPNLMALQMFRAGWALAALMPDKVAV